LLKKGKRGKIETYRPEGGKGIKERKKKKKGSFLGDREKKLLQFLVARAKKKTSTSEEKKKTKRYSQHKRGGEGAFRHIFEIYVRSSFLDPLLDEGGDGKKKESPTPTRR